MPARQLRDQFHLIHWRNNAVTIDDEGDIKKKTNLANKQATHQTSLFPMTDRKTTILNSFLIRPTYQISHFGKTQPSVDLVFKSSLMNWDCLCIFQNCMTKLCRRESKDTLRQKHALALCTKRKQSFSDHDDHKIQRWFLFFLFKSKTNKKGEEISNIQPVYEILQDLPTKLYSSAIWRIHPGLLFHSSLTKFHPKEMLSFLAKKDKNKPSTYKPKVPPKYWTFFANHITRMTEITICRCSPIRQDN